MKTEKERQSEHTEEDKRPLLQSSDRLTASQSADFILDVNLDQLNTRSKETKWHHISSFLPLLLLQAVWMTELVHKPL